MDQLKLVAAYAAILGVHIFVLCSLLVLLPIMGRTRVMYRVGWMLHTALEWMSGEGRFCHVDKHAKVPNGERMHGE
jgi:hypothetical protein